jgi:O-antigen/teichoic acid export membrane protein
LLFVFLPVGIGMVLVADTLIPLYLGESFVSAVFTFKLASILVYALGFSNLFGTQILLTFNGERKLFISTITGAGVNILLNIILIPVYQQNGAVVASIASEMIVTIMTYYYSKKYIKIIFNTRVIITSAVGTIIMMLIVLLVKNNLGNKISDLIIIIVCGLITYSLVNLCLKNPVINEFKRILKMRI